MHVLDVAFWVVVVFTLLTLLWFNREDWRKWRRKDKK